VAIRTPPHVSLSHKGTGGHFVGPDMLFIDCSFFCAVLSCNRGRIAHKGPNRLKHGAKSSRMAILPDGIAGADSGTSCFVGRRSEKGGAIFVSTSGNFFYQGSGSHTKWHDRSVTVAYKMCSLVHPEPIIGGRDMPISRFRGTTEHQKPRKCTEVHTLLKKGTTF
jgi:hypothetical protein